MKKFWKKYKVLVIVALLVVAFVALSFLVEGNKPAAKEPSSSVSEWVEAVKEDKNVITVIALSYCSHCKDYKPVITEIATKYSIPLYWFEIDTVSEADANTISSTYAFSEYEGASPYTAITKKGAVIAQYANGYMSNEQALSFLKDNGVIK